MTGSATCDATAKWECRSREKMLHQQSAKKEWQQSPQSCPSDA